VRLTARRIALSVTGPGSVSNVPGLQCSSSCATAGTRQRLALTATPRRGKLVRWAGTCSGSAGCNVTVSRRDAVALRAGDVPPDCRSHRERRGSELERGHRLSAALLGELPLVLARTPDRSSGEGVEAQVLERRLPGLEEGLHGGDERGRERPRDVRPRLTLDGFAPGLIR
jgi:hypothetical protein